MVTPLIEEGPLVRPLEAEPRAHTPRPRAARGSPAIASDPEPEATVVVTEPDVAEPASEQESDRDPVAESYVPQAASALQPRAAGW